MKPPYCHNCAHWWKDRGGFTHCERNGYNRRIEPDRQGGKLMARLKGRCGEEGRFFLSELPK